MKIIITEEQKKKLFIPITESEESKKGKLFIPRRLSGENSRFIQWNKEQPIVDGERINQFTHDGKKTGIWEESYNNGQLSSKVSYKDDKRDGIWESYYKNGQLLSKGSYKNDKKTGIWESYYDNGQSYSKGSYKNDKQNGIWEYYYPNGQLSSKGLYKDGKKDGIWEFYNDYGNGQLDMRGLYKDGKYVKILPKEITESEQSKKGKLFIPRRIDQRKIEAEELKQKYISEIKEIIEEEGIISMGELGGNSIVYGYSPEDEDEIALIEQFYFDHVEVVVYGGYKYNTEETSFPVKYEELKLDQLFEIRELLETYNSH